MAGMEDHCPKCAAKIKAPVPVPEPAPPDDPIPPPPAEVPTAKSGAGILEAVLSAPDVSIKSSHAAEPPESAPPAKERRSFRSTLFDEFLSTVPQPPAEADPPPAAVAAASDEPRESRSIPPEPAPAGQDRQDELPRLAAPATAPVAEDDREIESQAPASREPVSSEDPEPVTPPSGAEPDLPPLEPVWEPPPPGGRPDFGMGEMIAEQTGLTAPAVARHGLPALGVGLMQVEDTPRHHRQRRRRRATITGILLFLLFDALVLGWVFRHRISEWWDEGHLHAPPQATAVPVTVSPASAVSPPPASLAVEPEKPPQAPNDPAGPRSEPPTVAAIPDMQPAPGTGNAAEIPEKKDSTPPIASDPPMTPAASELRASLDIPALIPPTPAGTPLPASIEGLLPKTEITIPPLPPPLPSSAAIPEAAAKLPEPAPDAPPAAAGEEPPAAMKIVESGITTPARPALAALKSFLAAPTWEKRLPWVQKPDTVKAAMERHYQKYPDGPVNVGRIEFIERYRARGGVPPYSMFEVEGGDLKHAIIVLVEEKSKTDLRVDWEAFAEFKDQLLWDFLNKPASAPGKFRVMIRRSHSFDKDVPDLARKEAFVLSQPGANTTANVFAIKGTAAARLLAQQLAWGDSIAATVQLAWHGEGDRHWVELKTIPAIGWRG